MDVEKSGLCDMGEPSTTVKCLKETLKYAESEVTCNGNMETGLDNDNVLNSFDISNSEISLNFSDDGERLSNAGDPPHENQKSSKINMESTGSLFENLSKIQGPTNGQSIKAKMASEQTDVATKISSDKQVDLSSVQKGSEQELTEQLNSKTNVSSEHDVHTGKSATYMVETIFPEKVIANGISSDPKPTDTSNSVVSSTSEKMVNGVLDIKAVAQTTQSEPVKIVKKQKARKSCHSSSASGYSSAASSSACSPTKINIASFARKTIKVTELESVLGLKASSLNKMDAKELDMLVLQKARQHLSSRDGKPPKIVQKPVSIVPSPKGNNQETVQGGSKPAKLRDSISPQSSKLKDSFGKGSNQLITQFMVKKNTSQVSEDKPKFLDNSIGNDTSFTVMKEADLESNSSTLPPENSDQVQPEGDELGAHPSGVSAVITGQLLLNKSKKKRKNYRGRSGGYRLPGEKIIKKVKRRNSNDGTAQRIQGGDRRKSEGDKLADSSNSEGLNEMRKGLYHFADGDTSQNDSHCESLGSIEGVKPPKRKYKKRMYALLTDSTQAEGLGRPSRRLTREKAGKDNAEDEMESQDSSRTRRSSRKRKMTALFGDDSDSTVSTEHYDAESDWSDSEIGEQTRMNKVPISTEDESLLTDDSDHAQGCPCCRNDSPDAFMNKKRRKVSQEDEMEDEEEILELPDLSPIKPPIKPTNPDISPPKISPRPLVPIPQKSDLKIEEKKLGENTAVAIPNELPAHQPFKFMNTPNGMSYPVTPPETPESTISNLEDSNMALPLSERDKEAGVSPVCFCRLPGTTFKNVKPQVFCQAVDSIDGKVTGCMTKVSNTLVLRPSSRIPFMALCDSHRQRLKMHQCCPGCGHFCTQGTFYQCKAGTSAPHHYHRHCQVLRDDKYFCPHCGEQSCQVEVRVEAAASAAAAKGAAALLKLEKKGTLSNARMGSTRRWSTDSTHSRQSEYTGSEETVKNMLSVKTVNNKEIKIKNVPLGSSKKELETLVQQMNCEEKRKKFRASNKNLYQAARSGDSERVLYLLCEGFDPNCKFEDDHQQGAIHVAASKGYLTIVHLLTQAGATPHAIDEDLRTPLMEASENGHTSVVKYLLKLGAVPDSRSSDGMTPLHLAAQSGAVESLKHIVQTGTIDVNIKDDGGWTPMIWAAEHRHIESVRFLLDVGSDPNLRDNEDNTGLHWAVFSGSTDIAELVLNAGCDIEAANEHGDRPLHIAARQNHYECVVLLIARAADSTARNNRGDTPLTCCFDNTSQVYMAIQVNQQLRKVASQIRRPEKLLHRDISCGKEQYPIPIVNEFDDENYPTDYLYVTDYVETSPMNVNRVITSLESCVCQDNCSSMFCKCSRNSVKCWYTKEGLLPEDFNYTDPPLVFECNRACSCWANCQNRVIQLGINVRLQVFRAPGKGWGVRSLLDIPRGTYVCEYIGEVLSDAEADKKEDDSYLFDLDNRESDSFCIDARQYGNVSRFINHRCEPNLSPVKVFVDHQDVRFPRICFFANKDIKAYQELGFDYGDKFWIIKYKQFTCTCDSSRCRYSKDSIHKTVEDYYHRIREAEEEED